MYSLSPALRTRGRCARWLLERRLAIGQRACAGAEHLGVRECNRFAIAIDVGHLRWPPFPRGLSAFGRRLVSWLTGLPAAPSRVHPPPVAPVRLASPITVAVGSHRVPITADLGRRQIVARPGAGCRPHARRCARVRRRERHHRGRQATRLRLSGAPHGNTRDFIHHACPLRATPTSGHARPGHGDRRRDRPRRADKDLPYVR
jgi:hypothetical protein